MKEAIDFPQKIEDNYFISQKISQKQSLKQCNNHSSFYNTFEITLEEVQREKNKLKLENNGIIFTPDQSINGEAYQARVSWGYLVIIVSFAKLQKPIHNHFTQSLRGSFGEIYLLNLSNGLEVIKCLKHAHFKSEKQTIQQITKEFLLLKSRVQLKWDNILEIVLNLISQYRINVLISLWNNVQQQMQLEVDNEGEFDKFAQLKYCSF